MSAGKTTFVCSLTEGQALTTDEQTTDGAPKARTTVGLDHGQVDVRGRRFTLFGTPGQERFEYMWDILSEATDGVVLLIPADRKNGVEQARTILRQVVGEDGSSPLVAVGVTRIDLGGNGVLRRTRARLNDEVVHVAPIDARQPEQCRALLRALSTHFPD
jgi:signal recognition particle receptor subunit beta